LGKRGGVAGRLERGDVRLVRFSSPDKERPAVIVTRNSVLDYLNTATVVPVTSTIRNVPSEVRLDIDDGMKNACVANAHNLTTVRAELIGRRVARLSESKMREVCRAIAFSLGCD
jgi:mRNA interferase MazF